MKEIVVISGKGGTGKTSLTASFAVLAGAGIVVADCDVDAADMHLLLAPEVIADEPFHSGREARIDAEACLDCGECEAVCRFGAIRGGDGVRAISPLDCEGCGYCVRVCPADAITEHDRLVGRWYRSRARTGATMIHAALGIGADNSGKLVARVKDEARTAAAAVGSDLVLVDGSPGIGCPVVSSLAGADYVVLVTEPTVSGLHDLRRVHELVRRFGIPAGCVVNKADLNAEVRDRIREFLAGAGVTLLAEIPYDERFAAAITHGLTITEWDENAAAPVCAAWRAVCRDIDR